MSDRKSNRPKKDKPKTKPTKPPTAKPRRRRRQRGAGIEVVSQPLNRGYRIKAPPPMKSFHLRHSERWGSWLSDNESAEGIPLNPTDPGMGLLWGSAIASKFNMFRLQKVVVEYIPNCPATTSGTVAMCVELAPRDQSIPLTYSQVLSGELNVSGPTWSRHKVVFPVKRTQFREYQVIHTGVVNLTDTYIPGIVYLGSSGGNNIITGTVMIHYDIELLSPHPSDTNGPEYSYVASRIQPVTTSDSMAHVGQDYYIGNLGEQFKNLITTIEMPEANRGNVGGTALRYTRDIANGRANGIINNLRIIGQLYGTAFQRRGIDGSIITDFTNFTTGFNPMTLSNVSGLATFTLVSSLMAKIASVQVGENAVDIYSCSFVGDMTLRPGDGYWSSINYHCLPAGMATTYPSVINISVQGVSLGPSAPLNSINIMQHKMEVMAKTIDSLSRRLTIRNKPQDEDEKSEDVFEHLPNGCY